MDKCKNCNDLINEIEKLRIELTEVRDKYSVICDRLWTIANKKREKTKATDGVDND